MKKQIIVIADMEGASGIFENNINEIINGSNEWRRSGQDKITSDVKAVCDALNDFNIDEIMLYDMHYAGNEAYNIKLEDLPMNVKVFDLPNREFLWRRIRGQAELKPYGIITVGQHSRNGTLNGYFSHTIESPPIKSFWINNLHIAEIGLSTLNFIGTKYIANIGCSASEIEAKEICKTVHQISVKNKSEKWEPSPKETYQIIKKGLYEALEHYDTIEEINLPKPYKFKLILEEGFRFNTNVEISWKGKMEETVASWEAPSFEIGAEIFDLVQDLII